MGGAGSHWLDETNEGLQDSVDRGTHQPWWCHGSRCNSRGQGQICHFEFDMIIYA